MTKIFRCTYQVITPLILCFLLSSQAIADDYSDAPVSYGDAPTTISANIYLGVSQPDSESAGQSGNRATNDGVEEDGAPSDFTGAAYFARFPLLVETDSSYTTPITVHNTSSSDATLEAWIDFDHSGTFDNGELATVNVSTGTMGPVNVTWSNLSGIEAGTTYIRLRLTDAAGAGEVEDHVIGIAFPIPSESPSVTVIPDVSPLGCQATVFEDDFNDIPEWTSIAPNRSGSSSVRDWTLTGGGEDTYAVVNNLSGYGSVIYLGNGMVRRIDTSANLGSGFSFDSNNRLTTTINAIELRSDPDDKNLGTTEYEADWGPEPLVFSRSFSSEVGKTYRLYFTSIPEASSGQDYLPGIMRVDTPAGSAHFKIPFIPQNGNEADYALDYAIEFTATSTSSTVSFVNYGHFGHDTGNFCNPQEQNSWCTIGGYSTSAGSGEAKLDNVTLVEAACETGTLTLLKDVTDGSANDTEWTLSATDGPTTDVSGAEGNNKVTNADVFVGTYNLVESNGPSGYVQTGLACTGAADTDPSDGITIAKDENVTCTFTNAVYVAPVLSCPAGYSILSQTGNATSVVRSNGLNNPTYATGALASSGSSVWSNNSSVHIWGNGGTVDLDLGVLVPQSDTITASVGRGGSDGVLEIYASVDDITYTLMGSYGDSGSITPTVGNSNLDHITLTVPVGGAKYIRFTRNANTDMFVDGVEYSQICTLPIVDPTVTSVGDAIVIEGTDLVQTVTLSAETQQSVSYPFTLSDDTATEGSDYDNAPTFSDGVIYDSNTGEITVPSGVTTFTVSYPTTTDSIVDPSETTTLSVGGKAGIGTINDYVAPILSCPAGSSIVSQTGNASSVVRSNSLNNPTYATGALASSGSSVWSGNSSVQIWGDGGTIDLDLGEVIPQNDTITVSVSRNGNQGVLEIYTSLDDSTYTLIGTYGDNGTITPTVNNQLLEHVSITIPTGGAQYIRFSRNGNSTVFVDGVEYSQICEVAYVAPTTDFGDAPISGTSPNGNSTNNYGAASHTVDSNLFLGASAPDVEAANQPTATANGDDIDAGTNDDDGISVFPTLTAGDASYSIPAANVTASGSGTLHAWIDFDGDGSFDSTEYASTTVTASAVSTDLSWTGQNTMSAGTTFARFRLTSDTSVTASTPVTTASDGEVEDYQITVAVGSSLPTEITGAVCSIISPSTQFWQYRVEWSTENGAGNFDPRNIDSNFIARADPSTTGSGVSAAVVNTFAEISGVDQSNFADAYNNGDYLEYTVKTQSTIGNTLVLAGFAENGGRLNGDAYKMDLLVSDDNFSTAYRLYTGFQVDSTLHLQSDGTSTQFSWLKDDLTEIYIKPDTEYKFRVVLYDAVQVNGKVTMDDFRISFDHCADRGDVPYADSENEGAHYLPEVRAHYIGSVSPDAEFFVTSDDNTSGVITTDEEAGVVLPTFTLGETASIDVPVVGAGGKLNAWIDWNGNDVFDASEKIATDEQVSGGAASGTISLSVPVPVAATVGSTYARFRWSPNSVVNATDDVTEGEIEDHAVTITNSAVFPGIIGTVSACTPYSITGTIMGTAAVPSNFNQASTVSFSAANVGFGSRDLTFTKTAGSDDAGGNSAELRSESGTIWFGSDEFSNGKSASSVTGLDEETYEIAFDKDVTQLQARFYAGNYNIDGDERIQVVRVEDGDGNDVTDTTTFQFTPSIDAQFNAITGTIEGTTFDNGSDGTLAIERLAGIRKLVFKRIEVENYQSSKAQPARNQSNGYLLEPISYCVRADHSDGPADGGTAPNTTSTLAYGVASHEMWTSLQLGATITDESVAVTDTDNASDDGISAFPVLTAGDSSYSIPKANILAVGSGTLHAWIDFDGNGSFDSTEYASTTVTVNTVDSDLSWTGQSTMSAGITFARFRLTSDTSITASTPATGASDGEVEDYAVTISAPTSSISFADACGANYSNFYEFYSPGVASRSNGGALTEQSLGDYVVYDLADANDPDSNPFSTPTVIAKLRGKVTSLDNSAGLLFSDPFSGLPSIALARDPDGVEQNAQIEWELLDTSIDTATLLTGVVGVPLASASYSIDIADLDDSPQPRLEKFGLKTTDISELIRNNGSTLAPDSSYSGFTTFVGTVNNPTDTVQYIVSNQTTFTTIIAKTGTAAYFDLDFTNKRVFSNPDCGIPATVIDFSDAPTSGTSPDGVGTNAYGVASHEVLTSLQLGTTITDESVAVTDADNASDDGISAFPVLTAGDSSYSIPKANISAVGSGTLHAWIDFDGNGSFDSTEYASTAVTANTVDSDLTWTGQSTSSATIIYARFRLTTDTLTSVDVATAASDGEVEDYAVTITDSGTTSILAPKLSTGTQVCTPTNTITNIASNVEIRNAAGVPYASSPAQLAIGDFIIYEDVLTAYSPAVGIDVVFELLSYDLNSAGASTATASVSVTNSGALSLGDAIDTADSYATFRLIPMLKDSITSTIASGQVVTVENAVVGLWDIDATSNDNSDLGGILVSELASVSAVYMNGTVELGFQNGGGPSGFALVADIPTTTSPLSWLDEKSAAPSVHTVNFEYPTFTGGTYLHGFTGFTGPSATPNRGASTTFCGSVPAPELTVSKTVGTTTVNANGTVSVTFTVNIKNTGKQIVKNIALTDDLDTLFAAPYDGYTPSTSTITTGGVIALDANATVVTDVSNTMATLLTNTAFDGGTATNIFASNTVALDPGDEISVSYTVMLNTNTTGSDVDFTNTVAVTATDEFDLTTTGSGVSLPVTAPSFSDDYGDAPTSYGDASHFVPDTPTVFLGIVAPDTEVSSQHTANGGADGTGDDADGTDDEDAYDQLPSLWTSASQYRLRFDCSPQGAKVAAWIDFNQNGVFDAGEGNTGGPANCNVNQEVTLNWDNLSGLSDGTSYARIRVASDETELASATSKASDGEVEDYPITFQTSAAVPAVCTGVMDWLNFTGNPAGTSPWTNVPWGSINRTANLNFSTTMGGTNNKWNNSSLTTFTDATFVSQFSSSGRGLSVNAANENRGVGSTIVDITFNQPLPVGTYMVVRDLDATDETLVFTGSNLGPFPIPSIWETKDPVATGANTPSIFAGWHTDLQELVSISQGPNNDQDTYVWDATGLTTLTAEYTTFAGSANIGFVTCLRNDYGDAPNTYGTNDAANGAKHTLSPRLFLGSSMPDAENDGQPSPSAANDDSLGSDDEDSVATLPTLTDQDSSYSITVNTTNMTGSAARLMAWIDFDGNGTFDNNEASARAVADGTNAGNVTLVWSNIPADIQAGQSFLRIRLTTDAMNVSDATGEKSDGEVEDYALTIVSGGVNVSGRVYIDADSSASQTAGEAGIGNTVVVLHDIAANTCQSIRTNGGGYYSFSDIPSGSYKLYQAHGAATPVPQNCGVAAANNPTGYQSTTPDELSFTVVGANVTNRDFGEVAGANSVTSGNTGTGIYFTPDNQSEIAPNSVVFYAHKFRSEADGAVRFTTDSSNTATGWANLIYRDSNCNGVLDGAEAAQSIQGFNLGVAANSELCLINKVYAPSNVPAQDRYVVETTATFSYKGAGLDPVVLTVTDTTVAGQVVEPTTTAASPVTGTSALELRKTVENLTQGTAETETSNEAKPGDILKYRIYYRNTGTGPVTDLQVNDTVPAFTALVTNSEACNSTPTGMSCTPTVSGDALEWMFTGPLVGGAEGHVSYDVEVDNL